MRSAMRHSTRMRDRGIVQRRSRFNCPSFSRLNEVIFAREDAYKSEKPLIAQRLFKILSRQRPTFPRSHPRSIIGDAELNYRVRNGNGCDLRSMTTGNL